MNEQTFHIAVIMDGNGRWAQARGLPRIAGHKAGADAVRRTVEAAPALGASDLTLYSFSSDNWQRPSSEVNFLMQLFEQHLDSETPRCIEEGIRIRIIGRRDRLSTSLRQAVVETEAATRLGRVMQLRIAIDYSSRDAILRAAGGLPSPASVSRAEFSAMVGGAPDVDLLIRTGGEQRLSDFLLWECAYAEFVFLKKMWPEFTGADLEMAVQDFRARQRRFGRIPESDTVSASLPGR